MNFWNRTKRPDPVAVKPSPDLPAALDVEQEGYAMTWAEAEAMGMFEEDAVSEEEARASWEHEVRHG